MDIQFDQLRQAR